MCETYGRCVDCPIKTCISPAHNRWEMDFYDLEGEIKKWKAEHPVPVYPTWYRWLTMMGAVTSSDDLWMDLQQPIPADIAEKLGIEPKGEA